MAVELAVHVPKVQYTTSPKEFPKVLLEAREVVQSSVASEKMDDMTCEELKNHRSLEII